MRPLLLVLAGSLISCRPAAAPAAPTIPTLTEVAAGAPPEACALLRWEDGDTPYVRCADGKEDPVRLLGIDTPESGFDEHSTRRAHWQSSLWGVPFEAVLACGRAATALARELCPEGSRVEVVGAARDRFQRRLGYVVCGGVEVNGALVARGAAGRYPYPAPPERPSGCPGGQVSSLR